MTPKPQPSASNPKQFVIRTCPHCLQDYTLGINGVADGCDTCEGIVRLPNGMIDYDAMNNGEQFVRREHVEFIR